MIFESEFAILTILVFSLTATVWWYTHGVSFSLGQFNLGELTAIQNNPNRSIRRPANGPILLPSTTPSAASLPIAVTADNTGITPGSIPLDQNTQLDRISQILRDAIAVADKAERLHNAAHEQLDSAHYALQNLLDELSGVMPVTSSAKALRDVTRAPTHAPSRQSYVTALAA